MERNDLKNKRFVTQRSGTVVVIGNNNQRPGRRLLAGWTRDSIAIPAKFPVGRSPKRGVDYLEYNWCWTGVRDAEEAYALMADA